MPLPRGRALAASLLAGVVLTVACLAGVAAQDARSLFHDSLEADDGISYSGVVTTIVYGHDEAGSTVAKIEHKAPHSWRIWYLAPSDAFGRLVVSNETSTFQYEPRHGRVFRNDWSESAPDVAQPMDAALVEKNYAVELGTAGSVAGRNTRTVSLTSKHTGTLVERLWIDTSTKLVLRRESYHGDGSIESKSTFDNIRIGVSLPPELFKMSIPSGMVLKQGADYGHATSNIAALHASSKFRFADPHSLPYGFQLQSGSLSSHDGVDAVQLVYGDGLRTFSLFEYANASMPRFERATPKPIQIGAATGQYADVAGEALASWTRDGLIFTIVGDLGEKEIARIGSAIH
ncbi:MAG: hypothetical protein M3Z37_05860 [Candidatus Eremiobacteraeota bacterium]|nr:hypothetical protein [Candidatus Eremiobacteraeota bacterium]